MLRGRIRFLFTGALLFHGLVFAAAARGALNDEDRSLTVSADGLGNVYIAGDSSGNLVMPDAPGREAFVSSYDADGNLLWVRSFGIWGNNSSRGVSADGLGNVYVSGDTNDSSTGQVDALVTKYDAAGNLQWIRQLGSDSADGSTGVSADGLGNVYISGFTRGSLDGPNTGNLTYDAFVSKYDAAGNLQWTGQLRDNFLSIPEPASWLLVALAGAVFLGISARRKAKFARSLASLLGAVAILGVATRADAGTLYAATAGDHGELYILDPATGGVLRDVGPLNDAAGRNYPMSGLAFLTFKPHTHVLYGATHYSDSADPATVSKLVTIDPETAEVTVIGSLNLGNPGTMTDLAFYTSGGLIGIGSYGPPQVFDIDVTTGVATLAFRLGDFPATVGGGIATHADSAYIGNLLYVTPVADEFATHGLYCNWQHGSCSPQLRFSTISNPAKPAGGGNYGALDFDGDVLYGLNVGPGSPPRTHLVRFHGGEIIDIGRSVDGLEAIAFIPEPASWMLIALAGVTMFLTAARRHITNPAIMAVVIIAGGLRPATTADATEYSFINVADTTMAAPSGTFSSFDNAGTYGIRPPAISGSNVAFAAAYDGDTRSGVFRDSGGSLTTIAKMGDFVLGGYSVFHEPAIQGEMVAFSIGVDPYWPRGIFMGNGGALKTIVREGDRVPGVDGEFAYVDSPGFNGDAVGFSATFYVHGDYDSGIFEGTGGPLKTLNSDGYEFISAPAFSNGTVAFEGQDWSLLVLRRSGDTTTPIYRYGDPISGIRMYPRPGAPTRLSISGDTVVFAGQSGPGGPGSPYFEAIVAVDGAMPTLIAKTGDSAPTGTFTSFLRGSWTGENPSISGDTIVFSASFGEDPEHPSEQGIFTSTNGVLATVIQSGDPLFGSTITDVMTGRFAIDPEGSGNLAFAYKLADGREGVALARAVLESIAGDYNRNGAVDAADYVVWRNTLGDTGTGLAADGNGNDEIDPGDYDVWRANFGRSAHGDAIPEPATIAMLGLAMLAVGGFVRRRSPGGVTIPAPQSTKHPASILCWSTSALLLVTLAAPPAHAQTLDWVQQFGTSEYSSGISADGLGNLYVSAYTGGGAQRSASLRKLDAQGNLQWIRQVGSAVNVSSSGVSADGLGNIYVSGWTGSLSITGACDTCDGFVSKYDAAGTHLWTTQVGSAQQDSTTAVSADGFGNVYVSGETYGTLDGPSAGFQDAFLSKYDAAGALLWTRQFGTPRDDNTAGIAADGLGNVYITGYSTDHNSNPVFLHPNAFLSKYDATGELQWQFATTPFYMNDQSSGVSADSLGNVFITGDFVSEGHHGSPETTGTFTRRYDSAGNLQWTRGSSSNPSDFNSDVSADGLGNVYIAGSRRARDPDGDAFVSKYDVAGTLLWTEELGTARWERGTGVVADGLGNVYISGSTYSYPGPVFVAKYIDFVTPIPGDYNANGAVDAADYVLWRKTLGQTGTGLSADGNGNDEIDSGDYDIWRAHFGQTANSIFEATLISDEGIPEPATRLLAALAGVAFVGKLMRRKPRLAQFIPLLLCVIAVFAVAGRADAGTLYGATAGDHGELYILDPATGGVLRDVGPLNDAAGRNYPVTGLAFHPRTGVLYGSTFNSPTADPATVSRLVVINPTTAEVTVVGQFNLGNPGTPATMTDLSISRHGILYGIGSHGSPRIYIVDIETGIANASIGPFGTPTNVDGGGLATLYSNYFLTPTANQFSNWWLVTSGSHQGWYYPTISNPAKPAGGGNYGALDFDGSVLYGVNVGPGSPPQTHLVTIHTGTGAVTDIGRSVDSLDAIAFQPDVLIPEPASWLLAALAGAGVLAIGRSSRLLSRTVVAAVLFWIGSLLLVAPAVGETITVVVPGTSNPWLAGMPAGSTAIIADVAPAQAPVKVAGTFAQPTLTFAASGLVTNGGCGLPYCPTNGPDGGETPERPYFPHDNGAENGISDALIPLNALVGVFLDSSQPNLTPAPSPLDFSTPASRDYLSVSPGLKQVFFIGDGLTSTGETQQVLIPAGATRLFLGTMDGCCNSDNSGSFTVRVSGIIPEPATWVLAVMAAMLLGVFRKKSQTMRYLLAAGLALVILAATSPVHAEILEGKTVTTRMMTAWPHGLPTPSHLSQRVVGPGTEIMDDFFQLDVDFSDTNILITNRQVNGWDNSVLYVSFQDTYAVIPRFTDIAINPATNWNGFDSSRLSFGPNDIFLDLTDTGALMGERISLDITAIIPEPATWMLAAVASAYLALHRRRSRRLPDNVAVGPPLAAAIDPRGVTKPVLTCGQRSISMNSLFVSTLMCAGLVFGLAAPPAHAQILEWVRQFGTTEPEIGSDISADSLGNVFISGGFGGQYPPIYPGYGDAFVTKYDAAGNFQWTQHLVTDEADVALGVSADGLGNVYISGGTGSFGGPWDFDDAFLAKYDTAGNLQWTRQLGTGQFYVSSDVSADSLGNVYISGSTPGGSPSAPDDAFLIKYDAAGNLQWTRHVATTGFDVISDLSADGLGNVYISGSSSESDPFLTKYDAAGNPQWTRPIGIADPTSSVASFPGVSADSLGHVYVASGFRVTPYGQSDVTLTKYDGEGTLQWSRQFGGSYYDYATRVSVDGLGNVYLNGSIGTSLESSDAFLSKYDAEGALEWTKVLEQGVGRASADGLGNVYMLGSILVSPGSGPPDPYEDPADYDVLIAKYNDCGGCEPPPVPPIVVDVNFGDILQGSLITHQFTTSFGDLPVTWSNLVSYKTTVNPPTLTESGLFSWQTSKLDGGGLYDFDVTATNAGGSDVGRLTLRLAIIPEPNGMALLVVVAIVMVFCRRMR